MTSSLLDPDYNYRLLEILSNLSYRTGELKSYLQQIAQAVGELTALDWSVVTLCQDGFDRIAASSIDIGAAADQMYELHGTVTGTVVAQNCSLVVDDITKTKGCGEMPEGYHAYLGVPLRTSTGRVIGTICSFHKTPRHLTTAEVRLVEIFAERAATAIDNYQLYEQQQTINQQLQAEIQAHLAAEEALRESEARFRALVENAADAFLVVNLQGEVIDANQQACHSLNYPLEELLTLSVRDIEAKLSRDEIQQIYQQLVPGQTTALESLHRRQDGTTFPVEARVRLFQSQGQTLALALVRDITEQKQAEKALERLAEIGELAAMIVHEVRNPLTTVLMGLQSFRTIDLSDRAKTRLDLALDEAERLQRLLNEILLYAKQSLQLSELELMGFLRELFPCIQSLPVAKEHPIHFSSDLPMVYLMGDCDKLKQVFINLLTNACEAIAEGEMVTWQVCEGTHPKQICIRVHNGGAPIPPDVLPKLTKPFFTTKSSGNGLGLAIVKRIVEAHGGELAIASTVEDGTTVTIKLPVLAMRSSLP